MKMQVALIPDDGPAVLLAGDPTCNADPCAKHGRCHCMCPCTGGDGPDDCDACLGD